MELALSLDGAHNQNRDGEKNRDERFRIAREIKVPHGVRPFNTVRRHPCGESLPCHFVVAGSAVATSLLRARATMPGFLSLTSSLWIVPSRTCGVNPSTY